jgi:hypothetical protein
VANELNPNQIIDKQLPVEGDLSDADLRLISSEAYLRSPLRTALWGRGSAVRVLGADAVAGIASVLAEKT